jgi:hypothetical protein
VNICGSDENRIADMYEQQCAEYLNRKNTEEQFDPKNKLHFKRRLVDQYFWLVGDLVFGKSRIIRLPKRKLREWFTKEESKLLYIILQMNKAASEIELKVKNLPGYQPDEPDQEKMMDDIRYKLYEESRKWK